MDTSVFGNPINPNPTDHPPGTDLKVRNLTNDDVSIVKVMRWGDGRENRHGTGEVRFLFDHTKADLWMQASNYQVIEVVNTADKVTPVTDRNGNRVPPHPESSKPHPNREDHPDGTRMFVTIDGGPEEHDVILRNWDAQGKDTVRLESNYPTPFYGNWYQTNRVTIVLLTDEDGYNHSPDGPIYVHPDPKNFPVDTKFDFKDLRMPDTVLGAEVKDWVNDEEIKLSPLPGYHQFIGVEFNPRELYVVDNYSDTDLPLRLRTIKSELSYADPYLHPVDTRMVVSYMGGGGASPDRDVTVLEWDDLHEWVKLRVNVQGGIIAWHKKGDVLVHDILNGDGSVIIRNSTAGDTVFDNEFNSTDQQKIDFFNKIDELKEAGLLLGYKVSVTLT